MTSAPQAEIEEAGPLLGGGPPPEHASEPAPAKRGRRWLFTALTAGAAFLVGTLLLAQHLEKTEAQHLAFLQSGQSINGFLKDYCSTWQKAHSSSDSAGLRALYAPTFSSLDAGARRWQLRTDSAPAVDGLEIHRAHVIRAGAPEPLMTRLDARLADFHSLDQLTCKVDLIEQMEIGRSATLTVKLIADGKTADGRTAQNLVFERWHISAKAREDPGKDPGRQDPGRQDLDRQDLDRQDQAAWSITRAGLVDGVRTVGERSALQRADLAELGVDFHHRRDPDLDRERYREQLAFGVIQHASGGVSAADYDGDSRPDLLLLDGVRSRLYRNLVTESGTPRFVDVTEAAGLGNIDGAHSGIFADFDNDGDRDLFVGRYLKRNLYFRNEGSRNEGSPVGEAGAHFVEVGEEVGLGWTLPSAAVTTLDYDRDGDLDLYLAVYGNAFEALPRLPFFARNGYPNRLYRNDGGQFVDVTEQSGVGDTGWSLAVAAHDVDADGWMDLAVASDFGRKNLYRNNGDGTFSEVAKEKGMLDFGFGMGLAFADSDGDGDGDLYTSNVNSNQRWFGEDVTIRQYLRNFMRTRWAFTDAGEFAGVYELLGSDWSKLFLQVGAGSSYFHNRGDGSFDEQPDGYTNRAGWGWGVAFFDLENDSDLDLYAANGWISDTPGTDL